MQISFRSTNYYRTTKYANLTKVINFQPITTQLRPLHLRLDLLKDKEYFFSS